MSVGTAESGTVVITLAGEVDLASVPALTTALDHALHATDHDVVIDAAGLTFCDASGLGELAVAHTSLARRGRQLTVVNATRRLRRSMDLLGLGQLVDDCRCDDPAGQ